MTRVLTRPWIYLPTVRLFWLFILFFYKPTALKC